jgi:hypothetical protein
MFAFTNASQQFIFSQTAESQSGPWHRVLSV